ncbi:regulator SirB [Psychromonas sp. MB-3u-54]|uniref:SirB2 family protein n=1 Tax=Psychromonas sp. MB-3u-54 TaxID=2058319 RepID=UPI000C3413BB|nr:SirB2 family protein [Psychromonas sp. MB-3u-54]PKH01294.1 regulator SirB [Psychromonas sp. MB-3u-54]
MDYLLVKHLHVGMAYLSISLFILRSSLSITASPLLQHKLVKILPHLIDTFLLLFAVLLMITIKQYPFFDTWLTAKLIALLAYIAVGSIAIKRGKTAVIRLWASIIAVLIFTYIIGAAKTHHALSWLALI